jgi:signal transduction histidine kinase
MPWDEGPCAVIAAVHPRSTRREPPPGLLLSALVLCAGFLLAVVLAAGPVVRRIRALTADVRRSLAARYAEPVRVSGSDEVAELAGAFNEAAREVRAQLLAAQEREETLRSFLANTTHDLMLPLTVLQGHLSRLKQAGAGAAVEVAAAAEEAEYIASLVHNLSAAAKLEAGEPMIQKHAFDLAALVERIVARHRPVAAGREIALEHAVPESPMWVEGDVTLVEQAVSNLVHNAVRHNRGGGHAAVVLDEEGEGGFRLRVSDDGPGVAPEQIGRLGERRFRTDEARGRDPEGLGLGLSIARGVAERHGFALTFTANEPTGLVAEITGRRATPPA